ncbi:Fe-S cluster assembly protein HesB [Aureimonas sp. Leaf454]|uniref:SIS domain-containing protein n=1 Tax=Aureimonas sp. Leaf454 TaxID=1736381 RepID=UPI0006F5EDCE|nr:SIS domain-containing protein [Aureimonas sp. Leaf454]KQT46325.1 Fe-S cluster assembly protein HesB [Aureimonas sp. Leaf454]
MNSPSNPIYRNAVAELGAVFERIDDAKVDGAVEAIARARSTVVFGGGRERLQIMGFAMRLYHMGVPVAVEGDMTTPPVGPGDLFLVTVGPGEISTAVALIDVAKKAGAKVLVITAQPEGRASRMADEILLLPAQTMADDQGTAKTSVLPMGSLYEGALFVLFEVMILKLRDRLAVTPEAMRERHTNLE